MFFLLLPVPSGFLWSMQHLAGRYNKYAVSEAFRKRVLEMKLLEKVAEDIESLIGGKCARRYRK